MAEALLRHVGGASFESCSAGSHPAGFIHDTAAKTLQALGIDYAGQSSKSWDEFHGTKIDAVITLCDAAAGQECPNWVGAPVRAHWSLPDPAMTPGTDAERLDLAMRVANRLTLKIQRMIKLDWATGPGELAAELNRLGEI